MFTYYMTESIISLNPTAATYQALLSKS